MITDPWQKLFWDLTVVLKCLPSSLIDDNGHVFKQARAWRRQVEAAPKHTAAEVGDIDEFALQVARDIWTIGNRITAGESQRKAQIQVRIIEALRQWQAEPAPAAQQPAQWADSDPDHGEDV